MIFILRLDLLEKFDQEGPVNSQRKVRDIFKIGIRAILMYV